MCSFPISSSSSSGAPNYSSLTSQQTTTNYSISSAIEIILKHTSPEGGVSFLLNAFNICIKTEVSTDFLPTLHLDAACRIIRNICQTESGKNLFIEMIQALKEKNIILIFGAAGDNNYGLDRKILTIGEKKCLLLNLRKEEDYYQKSNMKKVVCATLVFKTKDIKKQEIDFPCESGLNECRCVGHEFYHVCRFLKFIDSEGRLESKQALNEKLSFFPFTAKASCQKLFENGEDMRNLCGFKITENGKVQEAIGEFDFWQEAISKITSKKPELKEACILPIYKNVELDDNDKILLNQLFALKFPNIQGPTRMDASVILGSNFEGFEIIDVPGDGNCGISAVLVASGQMDKDFSISNDGHLSLTPEQREQVMKLRERTKECILLWHDHGIEIANRLSSNASWIGGEDFAFIARAIQQPIVLIQAATEGSLPYTMTRFTIEGNEEILTDQTPEQLLTNNPSTLFIYFNGVNHFQALKQNKSGKSKCLLQ